MPQQVLCGAESQSGGYTLRSILLIHQGWFAEYGLGINNPTWYLGILIVQYIIFYIIKHIKRKTNLKNLDLYIYSLIIVIGFLGYRYHLNLPFLFVSDCRGYASFFIGVLLYRWHREHATTSECAKCCKCKLFKPITVGLALVILSTAATLYFWCCRWDICTFLLFPGVLIIALNFKQINLPGIKIMSAISFQVYLWHVPVYAFCDLISKIYSITIVHTPLTMIFFMIAVLLVSSCVYWLFEKPMKKYLS